MAKRKLSKQQQWRVERVQAERSARAGRREQAIDEQLSTGDLGPEQSGLVIAHFGQQLEVEPLDAGPVARCFVRANIDSLVTGDRVTWRAGRNPEDTGVIVARQERRTVLQRPDNFGQVKPVAANIDHIILVIAPEPEPHDNLIDRYLVAAEHNSIPVVLLLNKTDLVGEHNRDALAELLQRYRQLDYPVVETHSVGLGADRHDLEVAALVRDQTSVFVGQSGVGKSSIIQTLLPQEALRVGAVSSATGKGVHTTTTARLFHLPGGGDLVDSPGIRAFGMWHMSAGDVAYGFRELRPLVGTCRFRNCQHKHEPGCALTGAVERGVVSEARMQSFRRIIADMEEQQARGLGSQTPG